MSFRTFFAVALIAATPCGGALAVEMANIELHERYVSRHGRVQLGDVAVVSSRDEKLAADLRRIDLFAAPHEARPRAVEMSQIRELLTLYDFDLRQIQFTGAPRVVVFARGNTLSAAGVDGDPNPPAITSSAIEKLFDKALASYLQSKAGGLWEIEAELARNEYDLLEQGARIERVSGGRSPWTGRQRFQFWLQTAHGPEQITLAANVRRLESVVVAVRQLSRGSIISAADLSFQPASKSGGSEDALRSPEDLVGLEAARTIQAGQVIERRFVQRPILVERNKFVIVTALASGVRVATEARALDDGARGDLIRMQALGGKREKYTARVVDYGRVEVYAQGPTTAPSPTPARPTETVGRKLPPADHPGEQHQSELGEIRRVIQIP